MSEPSTREPCDEMRLLVQADVDGELSAAEAAPLAAHLAGCPDCTALAADLSALSDRLRHELPRPTLPQAVRASLEARVRGAAGRVTPVPASRGPRRSGMGRPSSAFAAGFGLAAALACFALLWPGASAGLPDAVVAAHIRALQPGHLLDVVSTDQHTVKPWFDGRLPFAPPVKDLAADGFPLEGGRLDYLPGQAAATLVYRRGQHVVELFAWPEGGRGTPPTSGVREGYRYESWREGGMTLWAVSDLNEAEFATFVRLWRAR